MNIFCSVKIKKSDLPCKGKKEIGKSLNNENFFEESGTPDFGQSFWGF